MDNVRRFPEPITNLVSAFSRLPGVGPKTALRYVYYLLKQPKADVHLMARSLLELGEKIQVCPRCYTFTEHSLCIHCSDKKRDMRMICVVEEPRDISTIESTSTFHGFYHVLGGTLNPIEGITPNAIRIRELVSRIKEEKTVEEVILALSPTTQGEITILYLTKLLVSLNVNVTRLARGLPLGATIEFADEVKLGEAFKGRKKMQ